MFAQQRSYEFTPTHTAPAAGMDTWADPGSATPTHRLDPYLPVRLVRVYGDWAQVACSNGWTTWVDGRALLNPDAYARAQGFAGGSAPGMSWPASATPGHAGPAHGRTGALPADFVMPSKQTWPVSAGAAVVVLSTLLPWIDLGGGLPTANGFDVPIAFLFDKDKANAGGPNLGLILIVLAAAAFALRHVRRTEKLAVVPAGLCVAGTTMFIVQLNALLGTAGPGGPSLFDTAGFGVWASLIGAGLLSWGAKRR